MYDHTRVNWLKCRGRLSFVNQVDERLHISWGGSSHVIEDLQPFFQSRRFPTETTQILFGNQGTTQLRQSVPRDIIGSASCLGFVCPNRRLLLGMEFTRSRDNGVVRPLREKRPRSFIHVQFIRTRLEGGESEIPNWLSSKSHVTTYRILFVEKYNKRL